MVSVHDQQPVLSRRGRVNVSDVPSFVRGALDQLRADIERNNLEVEGPPFCIRHPSRQHEVEVEVGWPVKSESAGRVSVCGLPRSLARRRSCYADAVP